MGEKRKRKPKGRAQPSEPTGGSHE